MSTPIPRPTLVLFGSTGDLAGTKLFQALYALSGESGELSPRIVAVGRKAFEPEAFKAYVKEKLAAKEAFDEAGWEAYAADLEYFQLDMLDAAAYAGLGDYLSAREEGTSCDRVFYLAIPPEHYGTVLEALAGSGIAKEREDCGFRRVVIEKPFGQDQASAQELDGRISALFNEDQMYRIDHYLGKETVQNILAFRFANRFFEPLWCAEHIDHVQITVAEEESIRKRGPYYDATGAFRDLFQNHVLQLLAVISLEEPERFSFEALADRKAELLKSVRIVPEAVSFGQYEGYLQEEGVKPESTTETFAAATLYIDTPRWQGVPFYLRTGKQLKRKISEISLQFKPTTKTLFTPADAERADNLLTFRIQPDEGISLRLGVKTPRERMEVQPVRMEFCYGMSFRSKLPDAYELIFHDVLAGERIHTLRSDAIEECWRIVDSILALKPSMPLEPYAPGSWGPQSAEAMLTGSRRWLAHESEVCNGITLE